MKEVQQVQSNLKEMLKAFHDYCTGHSLRYFAIGGTALGALRHHGFIPWDDDIDIGMPRPDYEQFIKTFNKNNTNARYIIENPHSSDLFYPYPYTKLYDTQTTIIENIQHPIKRGLFLDIFPFDGAGNNIDEAEKIYKRIAKLSTIRKMIVCVPSQDKSRTVNLTLGISKRIVSLLRISPSSIRKKIDNECKKEGYNTSRYVANFMGAWGKKEIVPKSFLGQPKLYSFEDIQIFCPEKTEDYLTSIYGDWTTPPPPKKQVSSHDYVLNINDSYL